MALLASTVTLTALWVTAVLYGAYAILFAASVYVLTSEGGDRRINRRFLIVSWAMFILTTARTVVGFVQVIWTPDILASQVSLEDSEANLEIKLHENDIWNCLAAVSDALYVTNNIVVDGLMASHGYPVLLVKGLIAFLSLRLLDCEHRHPNVLDSASSSRYGDCPPSSMDSPRATIGAYKHRIHYHNTGAEYSDHCSNRIEDMVDYATGASYPRKASWKAISDGYIRNRGIWRGLRCIVTDFLDHKPCTISFLINCGRCCLRHSGHRSNFDHTANIIGKGLAAHIVCRFDWRRICSSRTFHTWNRIR